MCVDNFHQCKDMASSVPNMVNAGFELMNTEPRNGTATATVADDRLRQRKRDIFTL